MVIKSRRMMWMGHVIRKGKTKNALDILVGNSEDCLGNTGVQRRIILKWSLIKQRGVCMWIGFIWFCARVITGYCEHYNETSESIKCEELDSVNCY
jgi:hypothetical protein